MSNRCSVASGLLLIIMFRTVCMRNVTINLFTCFVYPVTRSNDPRTPHHPVLTTGIPWHPRPSPDAVILYQFADYSYDLCPLPDPDVGFSVFVCDVEHILSMLVCAATCLLVQMARLLLKRSRCLAYSAQRAMAYRGISLSWLFP